MSDPASQANELRLLEQKRLRAGLSPDEEARRLALADVAPVAAPRGFDVRAATAQVRALMESEAPQRSVQLPPAPASSAALDDLLQPEKPGSKARVSSPEPAPAPEPAAWNAKRASPEPRGSSLDPGYLLEKIEAHSDRADQDSAGSDAKSEPGIAGAGPVYDAAAYGLDPNDPNAVAWAEWYSAQGWDPATAYAYAQQMNAAGEQQPGGGATAATAETPREEAAAFSDAAAAPDVLIGLELSAAPEPLAVLPTPEPVVDLSAPEPLPELPAPELADLPAAHLGDAVSAAADSGDVIPELSPLPIEALEGVAGDPAPVALEPDAPIDLAPIFEVDASSERAQPPRADEPLEDLAADVAPPLEATPVALALGPELSWAEHAVPAGDEPIDFTAFDAEPATATPTPTTEGASPADSLELPPPEPLEIGDDEVLEVGEDVREVGEEGLPPAVIHASSPTVDPSLLPAPEPELVAIPPEEPPPASNVAPPLASDSIPVSDAAPSPVPEAAPPDEAPLPMLPFEGIEPTLALSDILPLQPEAQDLEPAPIPSEWNAPSEPPAEREPPPSAASYVAGTHRVVIHTADGQVRRGTVTDVALESGEVLLVPQGGHAAEPVRVDQIKAIFFMLAQGQPPAEPEGKKVRVTFRDGRQVAGYSADYAPECPGFFMVPADTRTHTARIWVYRSAVRQVSVS